MGCQMKKTAVVYYSKHGAAKKYAEWVAEETGADLFDGDKVSARALLPYDIIVLGGGIYSGGIRGLDLFRKNRKRKFAGKDLIVFGVGISIDDEANRKQAAQINFQKKTAGLPYIFLPGAFDPAAVKGIDKGIIDITKKMINGGSGNAFADKLLDYFENGCDLIDRDRIEPLVDRIKASQERE